MGNSNSGKMIELEVQQGVLNLHNQGKSHRYIAAVLGISRESVGKISKRGTVTTRRKARFPQLDDAKASYMPTPEQIEQAKDKIKAGWTDELRLKRLRGIRTPLKIPIGE